MPRINNKSRTTEIIAADYYNHNENYISQNSEKVYTKKDDLVFWSDFCVDSSPDDAINALNSDDFVMVAADRSLNTSDIDLYTSVNAAKQTFKESNTQQLQYLISLLPFHKSIHLSSANTALCGDNCYWLNLAASSHQVAGDSSGCLSTNTGVDKLYMEDIANINFANSGATQDEPFTISIWYFPIEQIALGGPAPDALFNKGGTNRLNSSAIFHKTLQYGLFIKECGKLEFTLFDVAATSTKSAIVGGGFNYAYAATSSTLSVRSSSSILKPKSWNHICVTYDGSGTREGMQIYVNCVNAVNASDVPSAVSSRTRSYSGTDAGSWEAAHNAFINDVLGTAGEGETPGDYNAMHTYATPLIFASTAIPFNASAMINLSKSNMYYGLGTQLPNSLIFDIAIWSSALSEEDVLAVCDATRNCIVEHGVVFGRDSGYINLSPKIMQKIRDQKQNSLSVIDRLGDRSDRRVKTREAFNDQHTLVFGSKISDEFKQGRFVFESKNLVDKDKLFKIPSFGILPDANIWLAHSASIKREQKIDNSGKIYDKALTFSQPGESWIQTKDYVQNAIIRYDLILGPYNQKIGHLNLSNIPKKGSSIFIEMQRQGSTIWELIKEHAVTKDLTQTEFYSSNFKSGISLTPIQHKFRRSFSLHFSDINSHGAPYKIRFRSNDSCWGIGRIEISSANQLIRAPLLIDHESYSGKYIDQNLIATPHTRSDIEMTGRTVSGISDTSLYFTDTNQNVTPFKDNVMLPFSSNSFFDDGIDESIIPGYSSPLKDKTSFTIELNSSSETTLGMTDNFNINLNSTSGNSVYTAASELNVGQPVNIYWNNSSKTFIQAPTWKAVTYQNAGIHQALIDISSQAYSTIDTVASASVNQDKLVYRGKETLSSFAQPITSFGFPVNHLFFGKMDFGISMENYITEPFLLEKVVFEINSKFEFANNVNTGSMNAYKLSYSYNQVSTSKPSKKAHDSTLMIIPSFSLLKLSANTGKLYSHNFKIEKQDGSFERRDTVKSTADDAFGESSDRLSAELITYAQLNLYATSSDSKINVEKLLNNGLSRDKNYEISSISSQPANWGSVGLNAITSSFKIEAPVRNMPIVSETQRIYHKGIDSGQIFAVYTGNPTGGRSINVRESLDSNTRTSTFNTSARGLVNNLASIDANNQKEYPLNAFFESNIPTTAKSAGNLTDSSQNISPYILLPSDKITLTCHYPLPHGGIEGIPGNTDTMHNKMVLGKNVKIHLYGSLIKENKEFHENMNQALTTVEVNEPIGCETVVDKFNIITRDEYFGSYLDKIPINATIAMPVPLGGGSYADKAVYSFENRNDGEGISRIFGSAMTPADRIGFLRGSKVHHHHTYQVASSSFSSLGVPHGFTGSYISAINQSFAGTYSEANFLNDPSGTKHVGRQTFVFPFTSHFNKSRSYFDEGKLQSLDSLGVLGKNQQIISREKYIFSHNHFGHYADIIDFAKDSRYKQTGEPRRIEFIDYISAPVSTTFVTSSIDADGVLNYYKIANTSASQSSNTSIESTITSSFKDIL